MDRKAVSASKESYPHPVMIEDEPVHEFYANLIGHKLKTYECGQSSSSSNPSVPMSMPTRSSAAVIPLELGKDDYVDDSTTRTTTAFGKAYKNALAGGGKSSLSKLSLDGSNRGYQLLSRMGWKESEGGLGRKRQGKMEPVKTVLKNNKRGLGKGKVHKARVTHPCPQPRGKVDAKGQKVSTSTSTVSMTKAERRWRAKNNAQADAMETKKARMMINSDLPEEYYAYLT